MLGTTDLPVKVVAVSVGYASRSHFSRSFSAAYGVDPSTYRQVKAEGGVAPGLRLAVAAEDEG